MLRQLRIENYELIRKVDQTFYPGLNCITGETGTGKSMILSALHLLAGARASDIGLRIKDSKAVLEATFDKEVEVDRLLEENELDRFNDIVLRREFSPSGRSRAFVNDSPVTNDILKQISQSLFEVHGQDQSIEINSREYHLGLLDEFALSDDELVQYKEKYDSYISDKLALEAVKRSLKKDQEERDFLQFRFDELNDAKLEEGEMEALESEKNLLDREQEIRGLLELSDHHLDLKDESIVQSLFSLSQQFKNLSEVAPWLKEIADRMGSAYEEFKDLQYEISHRMDELESDPQRALLVEERLSLLYSLEKKFHVAGDLELIAERDALEQRLSMMGGSEEDIEAKEKALSLKYDELFDMATDLSKKRKTLAPDFEKELEHYLKQLGIKHPKVRFRIENTEQVHERGLDEVAILFSSNKDQAARAVEEVASGGEKSRLMLAMKSVLAGKKMISTLIFDEIDTGISGEVAIQTGELMSSIGKNNQVISITHLPQVASKAKHHFKVSKSLKDERTEVSIEELNTEGRVDELAEMLSGKKLSDSARKTAEQLLS